MNGSIGAAFPMCDISLPYCKFTDVVRLVFVHS